MKSLIFIISFITCLRLQAQLPLTGIFLQEQPDLAESEMLYRFFDDDTFVYQYWDDVGNYLGVGRFKLDKKSITFYYQHIDKRLKKMKMITLDHQDTVSRLRVINPIIPHEKLNVNYQILKEDTVVETGKSDALGFIYFNIQPNEKMRVYVESLNLPNGFMAYSQFTVLPSEKSRDYVVYATLIDRYTQFYPEKTVAFPIKVNKNDFRLKINNEWMWYNKYKT